MSKCPKCGAPAKHSAPDGDFKHDDSALKAAEAEVEKWHGEAMRVERDMVTLREDRDSHQRQCIDALVEVAALKEALTKIANEDVPRPSVVKWREDGVPSKHDKCGHNLYHYNDCDRCVSDFARRALEAGG